MSKPQPAGLSADDIAAIRRVEEESVQCMISRNFGALARLYSEDMVGMPPHVPAIRGRERCIRWMSAFPRVLRFEFEIEQVDGRGDLAYVVSSYRMTVQSDGAPPIEDVGKGIAIHRRQPDGSWPFAIDIFNSNR